MAFCGDCTTRKNTGQPSKPLKMGIPQRLFIVPVIGSDGTPNGVKDSDFVAGVLPADYVNGKINETDPRDRWYPLPDMENVNSERADPITETFPSTKVVKIQDGVRSFTGEIIEIGDQYVKTLKTHGCEDSGVFVIDDCGGLFGTDADDETLLTPLPFDKNTFDVSDTWATDTTTQKVPVSFQFDKTFQDGDLNGIRNTSMSENLNKVDGLLDAIGVISGETLTEFTAVLTSCYGEFQKEEPITGLVVASFLLEGVETPGPVAISSVTENPDGTYAFVHAGIPTTESAILTLDKTDASTDGYEMAPLTVTAP